MTYVPWDGVVEHLFFHPIVAYPELAFDGDASAKGMDDYMTTVMHEEPLDPSLLEFDDSMSW